jgi:hypothetical protein
MEGLERVLAEVGGPQVAERLAELSGSDFTTLMLDIARRRAAAQTPSSVLRRYEHDRFVRPSALDWRALRRAEDALLGCLPADFDVITLSPLVPLATHSALGTVSQDKVVTAIRACEVQADPTNALALEAASRRRAGAGLVQLAGVQRVTRAQRFPAGLYPHFSLLGLVTAGRDTGSGQFERAALAGELRFAIGGIRAAGAARVQVALTPLSPAGQRICAAVAASLADLDAAVVIDEARQKGRGYYLHVCFKVNASPCAVGELDEIGDGGFTDWTAKLTANAKERLMISGYGLDRLARFR